MNPDWAQASYWRPLITEDTKTLMRSLEIHGRAAFGYSWRKRVHEYSGISYSHVRNMANGNRSMSDDFVMACYHLFPGLKKKPIPVAGIIESRPRQMIQVIQPAIIRPIREIDVPVREPSIQPSIVRAKTAPISRIRPILRPDGLLELRGRTYRLIRVWGR
jgi:hypothetical protein